MAAFIGACSLTRATDFDECQIDSDCGPSNLCSHHYCIPLPEACQRSDGVYDDQGRVAIAAILPLTNASGDVAFSEEIEARLRSIQLAVRTVNRFKTEKTRSFALVVCDSQGSTEKAGEISGALAANFEIPAFLTHDTDDTLAAASHRDVIAARTVVVSVKSSSNLLRASSEPRSSIWQVSPNDSSQVRVLAELVSRAVPDAGSPIAILVDEDAYRLERAHELAKVLRPHLAQDQVVKEPGGGEVIAANWASNKYPQATIVISSSTFAGKLAAYVASNASALYNLQPDAGNHWFFASSARGSDLVGSTLAGLLEGAIGVSPAQAQGISVGAFQSAFRGEFADADPLATRFTTHAYDAAWLVMFASMWASFHAEEISAKTIDEGLRHLSSTGNPTFTSFEGPQWSSGVDLLASGVDINVEGTSGPLSYPLDEKSPLGIFDVWTIRDGGIDHAEFLGPR